MIRELLGRRGLPLFTTFFFAACLALSALVVAVFGPETGGEK